MKHPLTNKISMAQIGMRSLCRVGHKPGPPAPTPDLARPIAAISVRVLSRAATLRATYAGLPIAMIAISAGNSRPRENRMKRFAGLPGSLVRRRPRYLAATLGHALSGSYVYIPPATEAVLAPRSF